mmetsp:Transcript_31854/g.78124  ORF Transcript_31854/g.78124 Transcript_31854/m.78124 type:complete len:83 (+) Transcript_31854:416-664(+)
MPARNGRLPLRWRVPGWTLMRAEGVSGDDAERLKWSSSSSTTGDITGTSGACADDASEASEASTEETDDCAEGRPETSLEEG